MLASSCTFVRSYRLPMSARVEPLCPLFDVSSPFKCCREMACRPMCVCVYVCVHARVYKYMRTSLSLELQQPCNRYSSSMAQYATQTPCLYTFFHGSCNVQRSLHSSQVHISGVSSLFSTIVSASASLLSSFLLECCKTNRQIH